MMANIKSVCVSGKYECFWILSPMPIPVIPPCLRPIKAWLDWYPTFPAALGSRNESILLKA